jgi:hypothetical protein
MPCQFKSGSFKEPFLVTQAPEESQPLDWYKTVRGPDLRQGDILQDLLVVRFPLDLSHAEVESALDSKIMRVDGERGIWIVVSASCDNMEGNGWERVITNDTPWRSTHPLEKDDVVLELPATPSTGRAHDGGGQ